MSSCTQWNSGCSSNGSILAFGMHGILGIEMYFGLTVFEKKVDEHNFAKN